MKSSRQKRIKKSFVNVRTAAKAVFTDAFLVLQFLVFIALYAVAAYYLPIFFYASLGMTFVTLVYVVLAERDKQIKISWIILLLLSCGCGYVIYFFAAISRLTPEYGAVCTPYSNTDARYFADTREFFSDVLQRLETAEKFIFIEFFIVADGEILERLLSLLSRKVAEGVQVFLIADDAGCQGMLSQKTKKRIKAAGVNFKIFSKMFAPFNFKLNIRDHRKIVVVDGKSGYVCGCNVFDDCLNLKDINGRWKDAGMRLDGAAVDGLTIAFLKNWEVCAKQKLKKENYLNLYDGVKNNSNFVPYAGGPEKNNGICRQVYKSVISGARERLYIMTPYFIPDGEIFSLIKSKAQAGVDVRLALPAVPDYRFMYRVTIRNAQKLIKSGVKVYYVPDTFLHGKVVLTESCATVGSVNFDYRAFFEELDNGVYTDDKKVAKEILSDFESVFAQTPPAVYQKPNAFSAIITAILELVSPLM